jgi:mannose-1-phosphate guanylyltransferase
MIIPIIMAAISKALPKTVFLTVSSDQSMLQQNVARLASIKYSAPVLICK